MSLSPTHVHTHTHKPCAHNTEGTRFTVLFFKKRYRVHRHPKTHSMRTKYSVCYTAENSLKMHSHTHTHTHACTHAHVHPTYAHKQLSSWWCMNSTKMCHTRPQQCTQKVQVYCLKFNEDLPHAHTICTQAAMFTVLP